MRERTQFASGVAIAFRVKRAVLKRAVSFSVAKAVAVFAFPVRRNDVQLSTLLVGVLKLADRMQIIVTNIGVGDGWWGRRRRR